MMSPTSTIAQPGMFLTLVARRRVPFFGAHRWPAKVIAPAKVPWLSKTSWHYRKVVSVVMRFLLGLRNVWERDGRNGYTKSLSLGPKVALAKWVSLTLDMEWPCKIGSSKWIQMEWPHQCRFHSHTPMPESTCCRFSYIIGIFVDVMLLWSIQVAEKLDQDASQSALHVASNVQKICSFMKKLATTPQWV